MVFILQILKTILRGNTLCKFCSNYVLEVFGDFLIIKVTVASFKLKLENRKSDHSGVTVGGAHFQNPRLARVFKMWWSQGFLPPKSCNGSSKIQNM